MTWTTTFRAALLCGVTQSTADMSSTITADVADVSATPAQEARVESSNPGLDNQADESIPAQCSPKPPKSCTDMYEACEDKKGRCTREIDEGKTLCAFCLDDCWSGRSYKYRECYKCGFDDP